jgi:error-prone DNA polymerase
LCSLLDEQPMGFYAPDALVHEAQRRGIEVLAPDANHSAVGCTVTDSDAVRIGLGYVLGARADEVATLVAERRANGPFTDLADLASRAGGGRAMLQTLAWSGACDELAGGGPHARRAALWALGAAAPGHRVAGAEAGPHPPADSEEHYASAAAARRARKTARVRGAGTQLSLPLPLPDAPALTELQPWDAMIADYATTGMTTGSHPLALMRAALRGAGLVASADLPKREHNTPVRIGGLVIARQRPGTASGIVFMLLEDEHGTINLVVPAEVYERHRLIVRTEPMVAATGRLERHPAGGGQINVLVRTLQTLEDVVAGPLEDAASLEPIGDLRAVAPPILSFAQGRRR